jgi:hypothetical protein
MSTPSPRVSRTAFLKTAITAVALPAWMRNAARRICEVSASLYAWDLHDEGVERILGIVGVLPSFVFPGNEVTADQLVPLALPVSAAWNDPDHFRVLKVLARLKPGTLPDALFWYGSRHRRIVWSVTPMISAASHHFRLPDIAFRIASCTFIASSISQLQITVSRLRPTLWSCSILRNTPATKERRP